MEARLTLLRVQKAGNAEEEYEDAYCPTENGSREGAELRFAVADGASEGMLSGGWAKILVELHCRFDWAEGSLEQFLDRAYGDWKAFNAEYLRGRETRQSPVQWYEEPGFEEGAFSTLLGLTMTGSSTDRPGGWTACAVGDSCLFQVRGGALVRNFPVEQSSDFNNRPVLLASNPARNGQAGGALKRESGTFESGDVFYLMTDALARWALREHEEGRNPWAVLRSYGTRDAKAFGLWVTALRKDRELRNDDVTVLRIDLLEPSANKTKPADA
jgi:Protein phosphatase 2C